MSVYAPKHDMYKILSPGKEGSAELEHSSIKHPLLAHDGLVPAGSYVRLLINGKVIMTNTPMEYETNSEFIENCYGDVFVAGLGMGMIIMEVQDKPEVCSVTVLENNPDVIRLVKPQLPLSQKVRIIQGDIFTFNMARQYDYIYFDIWFDNSPQVYFNEILPLISRYKQNLKPGDKPFPRITAWGKAEGDAHMA